MISLLIAAVIFREPDLVQSGYVRKIIRSDGVAISQTEARRFSAPGKPDLWLVGAAHVGLKKYYAELQALLDSLDVVLFEGVRQSKDSPQIPMIPPRAAKTLYQVLSDSIGLDFQLADIHYTNPHWINSDVTMEAMQAMQNQSGKGKASGLSNVMEMLKPGSEMANQMSQFFKTATPGVKEALKIFLVDKLSKIDTLLAAETDPDTLRILLHNRNASVEKFFAKTLAKAPPPKSIGIFYGAAHQPEIEASMRKLYGYKPVEEHWYTFATADTKKLDAAGREFLNVLQKSAPGF